MKHFKSHLLLLFALMMPFIANAASASGFTNEIITLSLRDYSSTGTNIYNDLLDGKIHAVSYTWSSSNESATEWSHKANTFAYVKFSQPGNYTVTFNLKYTFSGSTKSYTFKGTWDVTVTASGPTSISVSSSKNTIKVGESTTVSASVYGGTSSVSWSKSNSNVSISSNGSSCTVTGVSAGTTRITGSTYNGLSDYLTITVEEPNTISLSRSSLELSTGETATVTANITGPNNTSCSWTSSNTSVVKVSPNGTSATLVAADAGTATITAKAADGTSATCIVTVKNPPVQDLYVCGSLTGWYFLDDFKFTTTDDGKTYTLYLDYLANEFRIGTKDWATSLGSDSPFTAGQSLALVQNSNNISFSEPCEHLKLTYTPANNTLKAEYAHRPIDPLTNIHRVWLHTSSDGGFIGINVPEGSRVPFQIGSSEGWSSKAWILSEDMYNDLLHDDVNNIYLTPAISKDCTIGVSFEKTTGVENVETANRVKLMMTDNGVRLTNLTEDIIVETSDIKGITHSAVADYDSLDITLAPNNVYIISLSNGQTFKILK